jgi:enoyl-[acyl-carrier-protein] reductase (NADH)
MSQNMIKNNNIKKAIDIMHPIPKIGEGTDFAELGSYLLSENNKWITGQILHIDGGRSTLRIKT